MRDAKFIVGQQVTSKAGDSGPISNIRFVQGEHYYRLQLHDGYYDQDGTTFYNSKLIRFSDWIVEEYLEPKGGE
jgi:hypothetical protein